MNHGILSDLRIKHIQPPSELASGFLSFAKEIKSISDSLDRKLSIEEMNKKIQESFSSKIRWIFLIWIIDLNKIVDFINILLIDLKTIAEDENLLSGDPINRYELIIHTFFNEFFKLQEISRVSLKKLCKEISIPKKDKMFFVNSYYKVFDDFYKIRNKIIHQGIEFSETIELDIEILNYFSKNEKEKAYKILHENNTKEGTLYIQCLLFILVIKNAMSKFTKLQEKLMEVLAGLILAFEKE